MTQPMPLETERLWLRPVEMTHAPALQVLVSDRLIAATTMNIPHPYPDNGAADWIQGVLERRAAGTGDHTFTIIRKDGEVVMGGIGINPGPGGFSAEVGYWIGVSYWNQGYMTEAARRVVQFGFEALNLNRIFATYFTHNPASARVMQKIGMTFEGVMRQHDLKWGEFADVGYYSILRSEFETQRT